MSIIYRIKKLIPKKVFKALQPAYHFLMAWFSALVYRNPSEDLVVIGVTGTGGKTTSVYLIAKMLEEAGLKTGFTSTAAFNDGEKEWLNDKKMTMIGRFFTQKMLARMVKNGCRYAVIETTSEGVMQYRHRFINYDILVFTGLYPEHIDAHGSFEKYKEAKGRLFAHLQNCKTKRADESGGIVRSESGFKKIGLRQIEKTIIVNGDDEHANYFLGFHSIRKIAYEQNKHVWGIKDLETIGYGAIAASGKGTDFSVNGHVVHLGLLGEFNAANAMNAVCTGLSLGLEMPAIKAGLEKIKGIDGRMEKIEEGQDFTVVVDYAFEQNAVEKLYGALKHIPHEKIIHVLGSTGGGRDIARRPVLGKLAGTHAAYVIVTNEDPYDDDPEIIIDQVALGAEQAGKKNNKDLFKILDRRQAIQKALSLAQKNDIVLITGKGSEQAICSAGGEKIPWDDRAVVRALLDEKWK